LQVRDGFGSGANLVLEATVTNGRISILDGANGSVAISVPAAVMQAIDAGEYKYDLEAVDGVTVYPWLEGCFKINPEVTV